MKPTPAHFILALAALAILASAALVALHDQVPTWFELVALGALTGGAGIAVPNHAADHPSSPPAVPPRDDASSPPEA